MAANGLNLLPATSIARKIADFGFNCVRLPFSLDNVIGNQTRLPNPSISVAANPELLGSSSFEVFDATLTALTSHGLMVIVNNHVSSRGWCCSFSDGEGLWYTRRYSEGAWLDAIGLVAAKYRDNPLVVGFDLRNEVRPSGLGSPAWGAGNPVNDWSIAAVKGAERVVRENDGMLVIISGLFYGIFLCDVPRRPVHVLVPALVNRTVYTAHEYKWFNFHLVARAGIGAYFLTLASWIAGLWLFLLVGWFMERRRCFARGRVTHILWKCLFCRCSQVCCVRALGLCELLVAILLTGVSIVGLNFTSLFLRKCSLRDFITSMVFLAVAFLCSVVSLVLWMRLALACAQRTHLDLQGRAEQADAMANPEQSAVPPPRPCTTLQPSVRELPLAFKRSLEVEQGSLAAAAALDSGDAAGAALAGGDGLGAGRAPQWRHRVLTPLRSARCLLTAVTGIVLASLAYTFFKYGIYEAFADELDTRWGFLLDASAEEAAPVWVGEFGSHVNDLWWCHMMRYIREREVDWAYWSINGQKTNNSSETFGIFMEDFETVRHSWKLQALQDLINSTFSASQAD